MNFNFYYCEICGNVVVRAAAHTEALVCCGEDMKKLEADTTDAAKEKHVPEIKRNGNTIDVAVGSTLHPMEKEHYIEFIAAVQDERIQIQRLSPDDEPKAQFQIADGPVTVFEFCNKHGLWKTEA